ncbi:MAG TPA: zf-HC2 domain-containing protein [Thermoanaerobaculia bacterium]|jgi:hypothetical protein|nr:zf-HC2 domain-containing protein [Thermoanaerobaculia bacterium]
MDTCPPLEEIAAFLDDMLSPEDRERITSHLTSCESCYEVFAGAAQFQEYERSGEDTGEVVVQPPLGRKTDGTGVSLGALFPFVGEADRSGVSLPPVAAPEKVRPRASRWLALAASVLLVSVLGFVAGEFLAPPKMVLADVARPLEQEKNISDLLYANPTRGESPEGDTLSMRPNFMAGVYLLGLRLSVQAEDVERTAARLQGLALSLQEIPLLPEGLAEKYEEEYQRMKTPSDLGRFVPDLPAKETEIQEELADHQAFQFGLWTEAGRLSALTESPEFFDRRENSRFLSDLLKEEALPVPPDLQEAVLEHLQAVRSAWDEGPQDYQTIAEHLRLIIEAIDHYEEDYSFEN